MTESPAPLARADPSGPFATPASERRVTTLTTPQNPRPAAVSSPRGATMLGMSSPVRRKIRVVRWLSKRIGEYDIDNDFWNVAEAQVAHGFLPFSRTVYLPN